MKTALLLLTAAALAFGAETPKPCAATECPKGVCRPADLPSTSTYCGVVTLNGKPVAGTEILFGVPGDHREIGLTTIRVRADVDGRFRITVPSGLWPLDMVARIGDSKYAITENLFTDIRLEKK